MCVCILFCYIWYNLYQVLLSSILYFHPLILCLICVLTTDYKVFFIYRCLLVHESFTVMVYCSIVIVFIDLLTHPIHLLSIFKQWKCKQLNIFSWKAYNWIMNGRTMTYFVLNFNSFTHGKNWWVPKL